MKILLLSAYDADSHQYWRSSLVNQFPEFEWECMTLPARYFSWRIRGNSMSWAFGPDSEILHQSFDLIIATSMTDLASLRGFIPSLAQIPTLLYFHENQFAYPVSQKANKSIEPQMVNLYSALSADYIAFNSDYNRETFLEGVTHLLKRLPDYIPTDIPDLLRQKSEVLEVPLVAECYQSHEQHSSLSNTLEVIWNHRWEYDKGPDKLLNAMDSILHNDPSILFHIVGQQFRNIPEAFNLIKQNHTANIKSWGYVTSHQEYRALLRTTDVVLSTAEHDYQGIAVLEAVASGAIPALPDRLAYKELFAKEYRYSETNETASLTQMMTDLAMKKRAGEMPQAPDISHLSWEHCKPRYYEAFKETIQRFNSNNPAMD